MSENFTPGPWQAIASDPLDGFECYWLRAAVAFGPPTRGSRVLEIGAINGPQSGTQAANAALIAAAPDLYEALQDCLQFIEAHVRLVQPNLESGEEPADRFSYEAQPICSFAQAALKKAREE